MASIEGRALSLDLEDIDLNVAIPEIVPDSSIETTVRLAIVRELAIAHGGDVRHEPNPLRGATSVLRLPVTPPADR